MKILSVMVALITKMVSHLEADEFVVDQSDCCGNGCANCILDVKPKQNCNKVHADGRKNILNNYTKFKLINKNAHTPQLPDILDLHFSCSTSETDDYVLLIPAGHHIMMRVSIPEVSKNEEIESGNNKTYLRPYSPYWINVTKMEFKILVNLKPQGVMSHYISNMRVNDEVEFRGPIGTYNYDEMNRYADVSKRIYLITQGVAIAPTMAIVEQILSNDEDMNRVFHLNCFTDLTHIYFRQRLYAFNRSWNYKGRIYLSHQDCGSEVCTRMGGCSQQCETFINSLKYKEMILPQRLNDAELEDVCRTVNGEENVFIIAGSREFQSYIVELIKALEIVIKNENIYLL